MAGSLEAGLIPSLGLPSILKLSFLFKSAPQRLVFVFVFLSFKLHASVSPSLRPSHILISFQPPLSVFSPSQLSSRHLFSFCVGSASPIQSPPPPLSLTFHFGTICLWYHLTLESVVCSPPGFCHHCLSVTTNLSLLVPPSLLGLPPRLSTAHLSHFSFLDLCHIFLGHHTPGLSPI